MRLKRLAALGRLSAARADPVSALFWGELGALVDRTSRLGANRSLQATASSLLLS